MSKLRTFLSALGMIGLFAFVHAEEPGMQLRRQWEEALRPSLASANYGIIIQLPDVFRPQLPALQSPIGPMESWRRYAIMCERELVVTTNGLLLKQRERTSINSYFQLASSFAKLPAGDLRTMGKVGIEISQLPQDIQESIASNWSRYPGVAERYLSGNPVLIRLIEVPVAQDIDGSDYTGLGQFESRYSGFPDELKIGKIGTVAQKQTPRPDTKGFSLGVGRVVTISELATRIRSELGVRLHFDARLSQCLLYVQGSLPKEQLLRMVKLLVETQKMRIEEVARMPISDFEKLMQAIESTTDLAEWRHTNGLTREMLKKRGEYSREELFRFSPFLEATSKRTLGSSSLTNSDSRFKVDLIFGISFAAEPYRDAQRFTNQVEGKFLVPRPKPPEETP